ncbi:MAG: hypothetical protein J5997_08160 [Oscillospiraceae bacterium]|nr:hypothetical protein [Oscillospiraceae bacterium]
MKAKDYGIILGAALSMGMIFTGCGKTTINANDYLTINAEGFDTAGKASFYFDSEKLIDDNLKAFGLENSSDMEYLEALGRIELGLDGKLDKTDELSNGDEVTFKWKVSGLEELEEKYKVKLEFSDKSFTVEGLEEPQEFDPFNYVKVYFDGIAPDGKVVIECSGDIPVKLDFRADKASGLNNGDTVKITANAYYGNDLKSYCFENGYVPTSDEKEFIVEGLAGYIQSLDEIPEDAYKKMDYHAQDMLKAHIANTEDEGYLAGVELLGNYLLTPKDPSIYVSKKNYIYYIYKVNFTDGLYYYHYTYYTDVMLLEDGTCSFDLSTATVPKGSVFFGVASGEIYWAADKIYFTGYGDLDSLFNKQVTSKIGEYKYESTVK